LRRRGAISPVIAELVLTAGVITIGTFLVIFASSSLGTFSGGFGLFIGRRSEQVQQVPVIETVRFFVGPCPPAGTVSCVSVYVRNVGLVPLTISSIYIQNVTGGGPAVFTSQQFNLKVEPGAFVIANVTAVWQAGVTYRITLITDTGIKVVEHAKP
jgi:hypothetical protein